MCNLYNITIGPQAILELTRAMTNRVGNLEPQDVYPDYPAPIVRQGMDRERELVRARWGMPSSKKAIFDATVKRTEKMRAKGKDIDDEEFKRLLAIEPDLGTTNVRNLTSPHWRPWQGIESRCVVPATSFSEYGTVRGPDGKLPLHWFAIDQIAALRLCGHVDELDRRAQGEGRHGDSRHLCVLDDRAERRRRADPPEGDAGVPDDHRRNRRLAARAMG